MAMVVAYFLNFNDATLRSLTRKLSFSDTERVPVFWFLKTKALDFQ